ncbi:MAG: hypothetical protein M1834_004362 [Cirrosporium novae-zelandiae]|nr:MAG: hypothetical protein M1834_004362 [Cirrosporium novae-zelandiae]
MEHSLLEALLPEPRVLIIMTGGTICMKKSPNGLIPARGFLESGLAPRPSFNDGSNPDPIVVKVDDTDIQYHRSLRTPASRYDKRVIYTVLEFETLLDSSSISAKGWDEIAQSIFRNYTLFDAFVVLHGTDSMAYTCSALSFMLQNLGKPVILTGSQAPMMELYNDATDNLLGSLIIAGHFMIPEVCLFFNYKLFRGNRTTKVSASDFGAFDSPNFPPLASITSMQTKVIWDQVFPPTHIEPFSIQLSLDTAHVASLRIFPGIRPEMVDSVLHMDGLRGLILETFGAGNAPGGPDSEMTQVIANGVKRGIVIVNITQCLKGTVKALYESAMVLERVGVVSGNDMTTEAALTKLSYLLALPNATSDNVARQMSTSIAGELTETSQVEFSHPSGVLTPRLTKLSVLGYAIAQGDLGGVQEATKHEKFWLLNEPDYSGNTPLHLAAMGPNIEILRDLLKGGASVHIRNRDGHTPLYLAANAGLGEHVALLLKSGAHLHPEEVGMAKRHTRDHAAVWKLVGVDLAGVQTTE